MCGPTSASWRARRIRANWWPRGRAEGDGRPTSGSGGGAPHAAGGGARAGRLGLAAIGVADRNTLAGVVRAHAEAKKQGMRLLIGCRLQFTDGCELIVYPRDRAAYGRLCRLLSIGKSGIGGEAPVPEGAGRIQKGETSPAFPPARAPGGRATRPSGVVDLRAW